MIKKFNEFVMINESFKSSKLRKFIIKNGLPKLSYEKKFLHDIEDKNVIEVLDNENEFKNKYKNFKDNKYDKNKFFIKLSNGKILVLDNFDNFKDIIDSKYKERHIGKQPNTGDDINKKHMANVGKLMNDRFLNKIENDRKTLKYVIDTIHDLIQEYINNKDVDNFDKNYQEINDCSIDDIELNIFGKKYLSNIYFSIYISIDEEKESYGYSSDVEVGLTKINDIYITSEDDEEYILTDLFLKNDKTYYEVSNFKSDKIDDYYDYYGVSKSDFY